MLITVTQVWEASEGGELKRRPVSPSKPPCSHPHHPLPSNGIRPQGSAGCKPKTSEIITAIKSHRAFVYCGHGSGEQYLPLALMRRLDGRCGRV